MSKHHNFKLKMTHWKDENNKRILQTEEHLFELLKEAKRHARHEDHNHKHKKIYDMDDQIIYSDGTDFESYA